MRQWTLLTIVAVLAVLAGGYFLLVQPKKDKTAEVRASVESQLVVNNRLQADINRLKKQAIDLPRQQAKLAALAARIPDNPALPTLIRTMTDAADRAGVELVSLAPTAPALVAGAPAAGAPGAPQTAAAPATSEPIYAIQLAIVINGGYVQVQQFFSNLEDLSRTMQVSAFSVAPFAGSDSSAVSAGVTASLTSRVYMTGPSAVVPPPLTAATPAPLASAPGTAGGTAATPSPSVQSTPAATPAQ